MYKKLTNIYNWRPFALVRQESWASLWISFHLGTLDRLNSRCLPISYMISTQHLIDMMKLESSDELMPDVSRDLGNVLFFSAMIGNFRTSTYDFILGYELSNFIEAPPVTFKQRSNSLTSIITPKCLIPFTPSTFISSNHAQLSHLTLPHHPLDNAWNHNIINLYQKNSKSHHNIQVYKYSITHWFNHGIFFILLFPTPNLSIPYQFEEAQPPNANHTLHKCLEREIYAAALPLAALVALVDAAEEVCRVVNVWVGREEAGGVQRW